MDEVEVGENLLYHLGGLHGMGLGLNFETCMDEEIVKGGYID